jgi:hypothetical protein
MHVSKNIEVLTHPWMTSLGEFSHSTCNQVILTNFLIKRDFLPYSCTGFTMGVMLEATFMTFYE